MTLVNDSTYRLKQNYHQSFEIKKSGISVEMHTLIVNPEDMSQAEPSRSNTVQTLGGAFVVDFGQGLIEVTISGTTGYKSRPSKENGVLDGYQEFVNFREKIYRNFITSKDPDMFLYWHNWEDNEHYKIQPRSFRLMRSKQAPLLYKYEFSFICLSKQTTYGKTSIDSTTVTNPVISESSISYLTVDLPSLNNLVYGNNTQQNLLNAASALLRILL